MHDIRLLWISTAATCYAYFIMLWRRVCVRVSFCVTHASHISYAACYDTHSSHTHSQTQVRAHSCIYAFRQTNKRMKNVRIAFTPKIQIFFFFRLFFLHNFLYLFVLLVVVTFSHSLFPMHAPSPHISLKGTTHTHAHSCASLLSKLLGYLMRGFRKKNNKKSTFLSGWITNGT